MNTKRTVVIFVAFGAIAAWLSAAITPGDRAPALVTPRLPAIDQRGADLALEIARLHDRLRPDAEPRRPGRNLFAFQSAAPPRVAPPTPSVVSAPEPPPPAAPPPPPLRLEGIAEDGPADAVVRTAIIVAGGQLLLAKEGDAVTLRYRVRKISSDVVELTDLADDSTRRLALK